MPGLTPNGRRVCVLRGVTKDIATPNIDDCMKLVLMAGDIRLKEEQVGVAGDVYIFDASVATPGHFSKVSPAMVKKFLICVQEAYPVKLKEVHIVNVSPLVDTIINFVRPFLKEKIRQRIHFHSNLDSLYKFVPQKMLPKEYGGDAGTSAELTGKLKFTYLRKKNNLTNFLIRYFFVNTEQWRQKLREYTPWFKEQEDKKANEALRPGAPKTADDLFGMDGTFRKLTID